LIIYSAARDNTKMGQFELFWYSHHLFVVFFVMILVHGKGGIGPNYWKFFLFPGGTYLIERLLRVNRSRKPVVLLSFTDMKQVFSLEFAKVGVFADEYHDGQYIHIKCPHVSALEWHPFTISSAPDEPSVSLHIRDCGEGSWTRQVRDYLKDCFDPKRQKTFVELSRTAGAAKATLPGRLLGPDGDVLFQIDGPHSAPTQHVSEYQTAMVIGAGIGVTPVAATLKSVVHRWRYHVGDTFPKNAYFYWVCAYRDINAFRWLIRFLKDAQDGIDMLRRTAKSAMAVKQFEFHIWVTSAPKPEAFEKIDYAAAENDDLGFWGPHIREKGETGASIKAQRNSEPAFTEMELLEAMMKPSKTDVRLGDVIVRCGRPDWKPTFEKVAERHLSEGGEMQLESASSKDVGVAFCGNPAIASDLAKECNLASLKPGLTGVFRFHKENF